MPINQLDHAHARILALQQAVPRGDKSIGPRELYDVVIEASERGEYADSAELLKRARDRTSRNRAATSDEEPGQSRLKSRRRPESVLGARLTRELVDLYRGGVETLRQATFGKPEPPFASLSAAAVWIESQSITPQQRWRDEARSSAVVESWDRVIALCDELNRADPWVMYSASVQPREVEYWDGEGTLHVRRVSTDSEPLASLVAFAVMTGEFTTLAPAGLLAWVLSGSEPGQRVQLANGRKVVLPGVEVLSRRPILDGRWKQVIISLDERELTDRNLRLIRQQAVSAVSPRRATSKQQRVVDEVNTRGGPPQVRFDRAFWEPVAQRLKLADPIAAARRYYRAVEASSTKGQRVK